MASTPNVTYAPFDSIGQLTSSSSTSTPTTVYTGPSTGQSTGGAKVGVFKAISTDTTQTQYLKVYKTISSVDYLIGVVPIGPAATNAPTVVDILALLWGSAMNLGPNTVLKVCPTTALGSGAVINLQVEGATF